MKTKTFATILLVTAAAFAAVDCSDLKFGDNFLEKSPGVDITMDTIFSSKMYAERVLNGAYATLRSGLTANARSDANGLRYEFQNPGNKIGWDNLDALTDIIQSYCEWGGALPFYYSGIYDAEMENGTTDVDGRTKFGYNPREEGTWIGIRRAYQYINNVDRVPDMTDDLKTIRKGEAKMIIACHMSEMLRHLGGVPILFHDIDANNNTDDYSRQTVQDVADFICQLCDEAAAVLPWKVADDDNGRFSAASAMGLKVRVLLFLASPLFNSDQPFMDYPQPTTANLDKVDPAKVPYFTWLGNYDAKRWQDVADACKAFLDMNEANGDLYHLNDAGDPRISYSSGYGDRTSPEILIHTFRSHTTFGDTYHIHYFGPSIRRQNGVVNNGVGYGGGCITLNYVDKFTKINGDPAPYSEWLKTNPTAVGSLANHPFLDRDPRLYESVCTQWDTYQNGYFHAYIGSEAQTTENSVRVRTGFNVRKFIWDYNDATLFNKVTNYGYLRISEIYLAYAEALNELGRTNDAIKWLNMTRNRAGLPNMTTSLLNKLQGSKTLPTYTEPLVGDPKLREEILDERAREFGFEEVRWFDIIRWKRDDIFQQTLYGITIRIADGSNATAADEDLRLSFSEPWECDARYWKRNFSRKWYFSAFPTDEINKGYGLVQNPGW